MPGPHPYTNYMRILGDAAQILVFFQSAPGDYCPSRIESRCCRAREFHLGETGEALASFLHAIGTGGLSNSKIKAQGPTLIDEIYTSFGQVCSPPWGCN